METAVALIDGEHYFPVIRDALERLGSEYNFDLLGAVFVGGSEKVGEEGLPDIGIPVVAEETAAEGVDQAIERFSPRWLVDLSDEPILGNRERFELASLALARGVSYRGADFIFQAPQLRVLLDKPSISVIGTGKRVGKTAVSGYVTRTFVNHGYEPIVVAMGRGGPSKPEILEAGTSLTPQSLLRASRAGKHAASDYYEDALTTGVTTIGCRRCGGGLAGSPFFSNVEEGAPLANGLDGDLVILEGSGAAIPPVRTDVSVLVIGAEQPVSDIVGYFGAFRILLSDFAVITMCEPDLVGSGALDRLVDEIRRIKPGIRISQTYFRPTPLGDVSGRRVFLVTTAPKKKNAAITEKLQRYSDCDVVGISNALANRPLLREDLAKAKSADVILTEIKAAGVDVVTEFGIGSGLEVVYLDNVPYDIGGDDDFSQLVKDIGTCATTNFSRHRSKRAKKVG